MVAHLRSHVLLCIFCISEAGTSIKMLKLVHWLLDTMDQVCTASLDDEKEDHQTGSEI